MQLTNSNGKLSRSSSAIKPSSPIYSTIFSAYYDFLNELPFREIYKPASARNYERCRLACAETKYRLGHLPIWLAGSPIPSWLSAAVQQVNRDFVR